MKKIEYNSLWCMVQLRLNSGEGSILMWEQSVGPDSSQGLLAVESLQLCTEFEIKVSHNTRVRPFGNEPCRIWTISELRIECIEVIELPPH